MGIKAEISRSQRPGGLRVGLLIQRMSLQPSQDLFAAGQVKLFGRCLHDKIVDRAHTDFHGENIFSSSSAGGGAVRTSLFFSL